MTDASAGPRVSVVIPTYNRAHMLGRAIRSVLAQTLRDLELIVVDDGSTDDTARVVAATADPRVRSMRLERNGGLSRARNAGVAASRAAWVAFLDDDDEWLPARLERQLAGAGGGPEATVLYCQYRRTDDVTGHHAVSPRQGHHGDVLDRLLGGWNFPPSVVVIDRAALLAVGGFRERVEGREDYELWLRMAGAGHRFAGVLEALVVKHQHDEVQLSADSAGRQRSLELFDAEWGGHVRRRLGARGYRRWKRYLHRQVQFARFMRVRRAVAARDRATAVWWCWEMRRSLPWSARYVLQGLGMVVAGPRAYGALARRWNTLGGG
jgi:glycosyltransferase involved in cell wall biosynthesis